MATPRLTALIDQYKDAHGVSDAELARRIGISRENLRLWRTTGLRALPGQDNLRAVARTIGQPYRKVLSAALIDAGYLTEADTTKPRPYDEVLHDAVAALTEAARLTNQPMRQTSSGRWEPNPDPRAALPIDWAEFVTRALAGAAANVGSTNKILSGRPGSWEAARVRETLESTVGVDDEHLLENRTDPVRVDLWVDNILLDLDADPYPAAYDEIDRRECEVPEPDDVEDEPTPPGMEWLNDRDEHGLLTWVNDPAKVAAFEKYRAETPARPLTPGAQAQEDALCGEHESDRLPCALKGFVVVAPPWHVAEGLHQHRGEVVREQLDLLVDVLGGHLVHEQRHPNSSYLVPPVRRGVSD